MIKRFAHVKELKSIDLSMFEKDLKAKSLLKKARNQVIDHMQPKDLCAHLKERRGVTIYGKDGLKSKHDHEYNDAVNSMNNLQSFKESKKLNAKEFEIFEKSKASIKAVWDEYNNAREAYKLDDKKRIKLKNL